MGAVFAIFSGFYYWFGKITGYLYSETLGKIHFWVTFIGVNVTFFPMHMLGLSGMPRRIPDYPDMYAKLNFICSIGSIISFFGVLLWFCIILLAYYEKAKCPKNPWQFYSSYPLLLNRFFRVALYLSNVHKNDIKGKKFFDNISSLYHLVDKNLINLSYSTKNYKVDSLEWVLNSPPELHTFVVSPKIVTTSKKYFQYRYGKNILNVDDKKKTFIRNTHYNNFSYNSINGNKYSTHFAVRSISKNKDVKMQILHNSKFEDTNITVRFNIRKLLYKYKVVFFNNF